MKKIITNFILFLIFILIFFISILATIGIETNKFNKYISNATIKTKKIGLELNTIRFKLDLKQVSLFLETQDPEVNFSNVSIPAKNIKVYVDFVSLIKSEPIIKKINIILKELDIYQVKKLSLVLKPSNFTSMLNNKIKNGKLITEIEIFLTEDGTFENFIAKGKIMELEAELIKGMSLNKTNLNFFADRRDILIKNIFGEIEDIKISDGDLKLNLDDGIKIESSFKSSINIDEKFIDRYNNLFKKFTTNFKIKNLNGDFINNFYLNFDNTYKIRDYNYNISGKFENVYLKLSKSVKNVLLENEINKIYFSNLQLKSTFSPKKNQTTGNGRYSFDNQEFLKIDFENQKKNDQFNLKLKFDFKDVLKINFINYEKSSNTIANLLIDLEKKGKKTRINNLSFEEGNNSIKILDLSLFENNFSSFNKLLVKTKNNDFIVQKEKKIFVKGNKFDATNLTKFFNNQRKENKFKDFNSEIEIDLKNAKVPMAEELKNFKLIGEIKNGKFIKISSKGDFGNDNYLDITMKKSLDNNKRYLEIYSDLTKPLLSEYDFFKGLSGGKLIFTSVIDDKNSNSSLKIENFKVVNAPGVIKILSLADLGGLADLAAGEGLTFDILEINMEKENDFLRLNEIIALGPSMSVLMDGYQNKNITSVRGTLVPAKTLNKVISKIPLIGDIIIPKEIGEGLFGISFKMKGPKDNIKTTINPIRTLTPRFIQKIIDKNKNAK